MNDPRRDTLPPAADGLLGTQVESVGRIAGATSIRLQGGWSISIYNRMRVVVDPTRPEQNLLATLVGAHLTDLSTGPSSVTLSFDAPIRVIVDLSDAAYVGPEAMQVTGPGNVIVVWN